MAGLFTNNELVFFNELRKNVNATSVPMLAFMLEDGHIEAANEQALELLSLSANSQVLPVSIEPAPKLAQNSHYSYIFINMLEMELPGKDGVVTRTRGQAIVFRFPKREQANRLYICSLDESYDGMQRFFVDMLLKSIWEFGMLDERSIALKLLDSLPGKVYWKDESLRFMGCNSAFARKCGLTRSQIVGRTRAETTRDRVAAAHEDRVDRDVIETGQIIYNSLEPYACEGNMVEWCRVLRAPIKDSSDKVSGVLVWIEDASGQMRMNVELARAKEKSEQLSSLLDHSPFPMMLFTKTSERSMELTYVSESISKLGIHAGQLRERERTFMDMICPEDRGRTEKSWRDSARTQESFTLRYRIVDDSGAYVPVAMHVRVIRSATGIGERYEAAIEPIG